MKRMHMLLLAAVVLAVVPAAAQAQQFFDFNGQATVPAQPGGFLNLYSVLTNNNQVPAPIALDFNNYQYTLVVRNLTLVGGAPTQQYASGTISIYEDNATPADYSVQGTFTDGTLILVGTVVSLNRTMFSATLGTANGIVDWTGGSRFGDLTTSPVGWVILSGISRRPEFVQPGYDENWDGKCEPPAPIPNAPRSWGSVKDGYGG